MTTVNRIHPDARRLQREARAASRCSPPRTRVFEQSLHEPELLQHLDVMDRIAVLQDLGLEVAARWGKGTRLVVDRWHAMLPPRDAVFLLDDGHGEEKAGAVLSAVASALANMSVAAVNCGRGRRTVASIRDALVDVGRGATAWRTT
jgi:hypothetical protein